MNISIETGFPGSCPHDERGIKQQDGVFVLYPSHRPDGPGTSEEAVGAGSRFWTRIRNDGTQNESVTILADWGTDQRTMHHDLGHIRQPAGREWRMIPGHRSGSVVRYELTLLPGVTDLALYPEYNCEDCAAFLASIPADAAHADMVGQSRDGRPITLLTFASSDTSARSFFIHARDHAYETAGSYCVEGIVQFLLSDAPLCQYLRSKFGVHIVPMTNPDGVDRGMSRLTWEHGADMNRVQTVDDPAYTALKTAIDRSRPMVHMNIHNWSAKFTDGLLSNERNIADLILGHMPPDHEHHKRWYVQTHNDYLRNNGLTECPEANKSWKNYCLEEFGATGVTFEFPWFGLNVDDMRDKGVRAFVALALAVIEAQSL